MPHSESSKTSHLPTIAITQGDPAGVGPEICLALLNNCEIQKECRPIVFGDASVLAAVSRATGLPFNAPTLSLAAWREDPQRLPDYGVVDLHTLDGAQVQPGKVSPQCGEAAFQYIQAAIDEALAGRVQGVATAPINKEALHAAGHRFPGHTEIFALRMQAPRSCMMQYSDEITCSFVTVHVGYKDVPNLLHPDRILEVIELTANALERIRGRKPRLLICGLNPHAGENGLFGDREEERFVVPAVLRARNQGIDIDGPVPPDTAFTPARRRAYDAVVCLYHDQGHIPVKMIAFESAVNTTLGLPVIRTSVDHGTAFDIAWQGKAQTGSLFAAVRLAIRLAAPVQPLRFR